MKYFLPILYKKIAVCSLCAIMHAYTQSATVRASSTLKQPKYSYEAFHVMDGDPSTAWVEGSSGVGEGEWIELRLPKPDSIFGIYILPGYAKSLQTMVENASPDSISISLDGQEVYHGNLHYAKLIGYMNPLVQKSGLSPTAYAAWEDEYLLNDTINLKPRILLFPKPIPAKILKLRVYSANSGVKYRDMAISEFGPLVRRTDIAAITAAKSARNIIAPPQYVTEDAVLKLFPQRVLTDLLVLNDFLTDAPSFETNVQHENEDSGFFQVNLQQYFQMGYYDDKDLVTKYVTKDSVPPNVTFYGSRKCINSSLTQCLYKLLFSLYTNEFFVAWNQSEGSVFMSVPGQYGRVTGQLGVYPTIIMPVNGPARVQDLIFHDPGEPFTRHAYPMDRSTLWE
jgi:hypothetical protein